MSQIIKSINPQIHLTHLHSKPILSLIQLKDKRIATGTKDGSIFILNPLNQIPFTLNIISKTNIHKGSIRCLCESEEGHLISCAYKEIKIWSIFPENIIEITTIEAHEDLISKVITLTNSRIASCSADCTIKIWKSNFPFSEIHSFEIEDERVWSIIQLSNKETLISSSCDYNRDSHSISFWDISTYQKECTFEGLCTGSIHGLLELPGDKIAVSSSDLKCLVVIDVSRYVVITKIYDYNLFCDDEYYCSLKMVNKYSFCVVHREYFCQVLCDDNYKIVFKSKKEKEFKGSGLIIVENENGKGVIVDNFENGLTMFNIEM